MAPRRPRSARSSPALVMLPLWAMATLPLLQTTENGCAFSNHGVAGGGVAGVADGERARQFREHGLGEDVGHVAHGLVGVDLLAVGSADARALLAAMLHGVEPEIGELGCFGVAVDGDHSTFVMKLIEHAK